MRRPTKTLSLCLVLFLAQAAGVLPAEGDAHPDLSGTWVLSEELSEDPGQKMREAMRGQRGPGALRGGMRGGRGRRPWGGMGVPGGGGRPDPGEMRERVQERRRDLQGGTGEMSIVQQGPEIRVVFADGRERILYSDGREVMELTERGDEKTRTKWKKARLVVKRKRQDGRRIAETWECGGAYMTISRRVESGGRAPSFSFRQVYERIPPDEAPSGTARSTEEPDPGD